MKSMWILIVMVMLWAGVAHADYTYYVPYLQAKTGEWTGVAMRNLENAQASIQITAYNTSGTVIDSQTKSLPAYGQDAILVAEGKGTDGWVKIVSSRELGGLCFAGGLNYPDYMYDLPFSSQTCRYFVVPHMAEEKMWKSYVMACNPNAASATMTLVFRNASGTKLYQKDYAIPAYGSKRVAVKEVVNGSSQPKGSMAVSATQPLSVFAFYSGLEDNRIAVAGINAVCRTAGEESGPANDPEAKSKVLLGSWAFYYYYQGKRVDVNLRFDTVDTKKNSEGGLFLLGKRGGTIDVMGTYWPSSDEYVTLSGFSTQYGIIWAKMIFKTDGQKVLPGACYYVYYDGDPWGDCLTLYGSKTAALSPLAPESMAPESDPLLLDALLHGAPLGAGELLQALGR